MPERTADDAALDARTRAGFAARFTGAPERVGTAPGRVNLIGEHTDYNGGLCLPVALPHRTAAAVRARADGVIALASAQDAQVWRGRLDDLAPGKVSGWASYVAGTLATLRDAGFGVTGAEVYVDSDVPLGAGLSSSAALECAVAAGVIDLPDPHTETDAAETVDRVIAACVRAEREYAGAPTGGMDQAISLLGRSGHALLLDFGAVAAGGTGTGTATATGSAPGPRSEQVPCDPAGHGLELLVIDTRVSHALVDGDYAERRASCERAAEIFGRPLGAVSVAELDEPDGPAPNSPAPNSPAPNSPVLVDPLVYRRARHIVTENARVVAATAALRAEEYAEFGRLMIASHASMRDDFEISCPELDLVVDTALASGAWGARMTGGGFGGSAIALVPAEKLDVTVSAVESAFDEHEFATPDWLRVVPSDGAR